jgi:hypothetical protein
MEKSIREKNAAASTGTVTMEFLDALHYQSTEKRLGTTMHRHRIYLGKHGKITPN